MTQSTLDKADQIESDFYYLKSLELGPAATIPDIRNAVGRAIQDLRSRSEEKLSFAEVVSRAYVEKTNAWKDYTENVLSVALKSQPIFRSELVHRVAEKNPFWAPILVSSAVSRGYLERVPGTGLLGPLKVALEGLLFLSKRRVDRMTPEERDAMLAEQARSWVRANMDMRD